MTDKIRKLIEESDALIALMTCRDQLANGEWTTHQWVQDEYGHARSKKMRAITMIETGVATGGMYQHNEYIPYNPADSLTAFLRLSATLGVWKEESGRLVKLKVQPSKIAEDFGTDAKWRYRFYSSGSYSCWQEISLSQEPGGCFLDLPNVPDDALIQIQTRSDNSCAESINTPQWVSADLKEK
ncbi:MAG: hypothetical protein JJV98_00235 [Desulfosarcina sp.]|nr:hypothetical protein [Desulfobacterales bacterium]